MKGVGKVELVLTFLAITAFAYGVWFFSGGLFDKRQKQEKGSPGEEGNRGQARSIPQGGPPPLPGSRSHRPASAGSLPLSPSPIVSLDAAVREALGVEVRFGALGIDAPPLRQGRHDIVKVVISRGQDAFDVVVALVAQSQASAVEAIDTTAVMFVDMTGSAFEIRRLNPPDGDQIVSDTARWEFDVLPLHAGRLYLTVSASMRVPVPGHGERTVSVPSLVREFSVKVDPVYASRNFVRRNWQWLGASALTAAGIIVGNLWR